VVAVAVVNGGPGSSDRRVLDRAIALASQAAAAAVATSSPTPSRPSARSLVLDEPARSGVVVTTQELIVRGRVAASAGEVRIMLESSGGKPLATAALDPTGHPRAGFVPFEATFRLSKPRPGGSMMLFVVAVDSAGIPIDGIRRRFTVGAVVEVPERSKAPGRTGASRRTTAPAD
jgi:hypothetical protein